MSKLTKAQLIDENIRLREHAAHLEARLVNAAAAFRAQRDEIAALRPILATFMGVAGHDHRLTVHLDRAGGPGRQIRQRADRHVLAHSGPPAMSASSWSTPAMRAGCSAASDLAPRLMVPFLAVAISGGLLDRLVGGLEDVRLAVGGVVVFHGRRL